MFSTVAHHRLASAPGMIYSCVFCAGVGKQTGKLTDRLYKSFGRAAAELLSSTSSFNSIGNINSSCQCLPGPVLHNIVEETRRRTHTQNLLLYSSRGFGTGFSLSCSSSHLSSCFFSLSLSPSSSLPLSLGGVKVLDSVVPASSQQLRFLDSLSLSFISPRLRSHGNSTWALASATQAETYSVICANFRLYTQVSPIKTLLQCKIRARYWFIRVTINVARHQRRRVKR